MNSGIWEIVQSTHLLRNPRLLPALKKKKSLFLPPTESTNDEGCRNFLLGGGEVPSDQRGRRSKAGAAAATPPPRGYLAVYVGPEMRRFVIPASYLCLPAFRALMERAAEEFGFQQTGGLRIPCEEAVFEEILRGVVLEKTTTRTGQIQSKTNSKKQKTKTTKIY